MATRHLQEQRCFVLDGENGATLKTLARRKDLVLAPNMDLEVTKALEAEVNRWWFDD